MLGKYRILEKLGEGGFSIVYRAIDTVLEHEVALKILKPGLAANPDVLRRFQQEARVTARLFHPNIVSFFETGELDGRQFIAMRYIQGRSLRAILETGMLLPLPQVVAIAEQIGAALDYAHTQGVIHRDVKPSNIIVDETGHATLMDFGIVKSTIQSSIETTANTVVGTPHYLAPEQAESKPVDGRADVYTLGAVIYHLLTGQPPFTADSTPSLLYKIVHEEPTPPLNAGPRIAGEIGKVVLKAMAKTPETRYQTCGEYATALGQAVQKLQSEALDALKKQVAAALAAEDFAEAESMLKRALAIQPDNQEAQHLMAELRQRQRAAMRYTQIVEKVAQLRAEAADLQAQSPGVRDSAGVLQILQDAPAPSRKTRRSTPEPMPVAAQTEATHADSAAFIKRLRGWVLVLGFLSVPLAGLGLLGIIGSIAMGKKKVWGRKLALGFTLILVLGAVVAMVATLGYGFDKFSLSYYVWPTRLTWNEVIRDYQTCSWCQDNYTDAFTYYQSQVRGAMFNLGNAAMQLWPASAFAQTLFFLCASLAHGLRRRDVQQEFGLTYRSPAALWPITFPLLFTGIGTIPAIGLLAGKRWARVLTQWVLALFCLAGMVTAPVITIGSVWAILQLRSPEFRACVHGKGENASPSK